MKLRMLTTTCLTVAAISACRGGGQTAAKPSEPKVADPPLEPGPARTADGGVSEAKPVVVDAGYTPPAKRVRVSNATLIESFPATTPSGFAESDLLAFEGHDVVGWGVAYELVLYSLAGGKVTETMRLRFPDELVLGGQAEWLNRDTLILLFTADRPEGDEENPRPRPIVVRVTAADITVLPVPDRDYFKLPKPKKQEDAAVSPVPDRLTVTPSGELWWSECPWGEPYDEAPCYEWVHARLLPKAKKKVDAKPLVARSWSWRKRKAPAGYVVREVEDRPEEQSETLPCKFKNQEFELTGPMDNKFMSAHWVSNEPPLLLVEWGSVGRSSDSWTLHSGCSEPIKSGHYTDVGPNELWIAYAGEYMVPPTEVVVYQGATVIGALAVETERVLFRPPQ